jgi:DNA-binding transcriptional regulator LsrR (DeoR family)
MDHELTVIRVKPQPGRDTTLERRLRERFDLERIVVVNVCRSGTPPDRAISR